MNRDHQYSIACGVVQVSDGWNDVCGRHLLVFVGHWKDAVRTDKVITVDKGYGRQSDWRYGSRDARSA